MSEELNKILEGLSEEKKAAFMERMKKEAELAVKTADEEKKREWEKKCFPASGHWECESCSCKMTADISAEDRSLVKIVIESKEDEEGEDKREYNLTLKKNEFFDFFKMMVDVNKAVVPTEEISVFNDSPWFESCKRIRDLIDSARMFDDGWFHRRSLL